MAEETRGFMAEGTTCESCAEVIRRQALKVAGVTSVTFDYPSETGTVTYDPGLADIDTILLKIGEKGYSCSILADAPAPRTAGSRTAGWFFGLLGLLIVGYFLLRMAETIPIPTISQNTGLGLLFAVGLLTGFHCVAMCGGFVVSYTAHGAQKGVRPARLHLMYAVGKTVSYTVIGAAFGLLGSIIAFTPAMRGVAGVLAGLFLIVFGLKMLNIFPSLRRFGLRMPSAVARFAGTTSRRHSSPLVIGLLNGLMIACGPLQAIYIMAAGTGSMLEGAKLLFVFGLGTLPVLLGFGYVTSIISSRATTKILKASGALVIVLGIVMLNTGLALTGTGYDVTSLMAKAGQGGILPVIAYEADDAPLQPEDGYQVIEMKVTRSGWEPDRFVLKKGVPVRWRIDGVEITSCNNAIQVPAYGLSFPIRPGIQEIEFTPTEAGVVSWSCWMGMISGTFVVVDGIDTADATAVQKALAAAPGPAAGGSCGMGGGCGCGR
ncbi:sulfite exporter TauE/SafE family protein [Candidatus Woesearchaeota archaeon]|nr:sulfite exporter TauE/SafE family protein [Candidatus Woesearchaeota archaeon]